MNDEEFTAILAMGYEAPGTEFKGSGCISDKQLFAQVTKAILGMANRRDGGRIIIGVEDDGGVLIPIGLSKANLDTWKYDDVSAKLAEYADPSVNYDLRTERHNDKDYVILYVGEFADIPIICKKDYPEVLRKGACYVRPRRKPETTEIPTQEDMRDLLDLAAEKRLRKNLERVSRAGGVIIPFQTAGRSVSPQELFDKQLGDLK